MAAWNQRLSSLTDRAWSAVLSVRIRHNVQSDRLNPVDRRGPVIGSLLGVVPRCRIRPNPPPEPRMVSLLTHRTACVVALLGVAATAGAQTGKEADNARGERIAGFAATAHGHDWRLGAEERGSQSAVTGNAERPAE